MNDPELELSTESKNELTESLEDVCSVEVATQSRFTGDNAGGKQEEKASTRQFGFARRWLSRKRAKTDLDSQHGDTLRSHLSSEFQRILACGIERG